MQLRFIKKHIVTYEIESAKKALCPDNHCVGCLLSFNQKINQSINQIQSINQPITTNQYDSHISFLRLQKQMAT